MQTYDAPEPGARSPRNASYDIDVRLDHAARTLRGRETIRWRNISAKPTSELQFHLYWNAWRNADSTWLRERRMARTYTAPRPDGWGAIDVSAVRLREPSGSTRDLTAATRFIAPDEGNALDRTVMAVPLGLTVEPNETIQLDVEWTARVPRPFARTGYIGDFYFIAQWFPKLGVLEDAGWNTHQFHSATEFYADFGVYDVRITVPTTFVVGATGRRTARTENADGSTTYRYHGEDVHDFAWTAGPDLIDLSRTFTHPTLPSVEMRLLLQPEHRGQADRYFAATEAALKRYGEWFGAYPYGYATVVDPAFQSQADGMEYPTFFTGRARWLPSGSSQTPEMTVAHETGHQWWYGIVATNEFEHAWMDEGINTYATARVLDEAFPANRWELRYFGTLVPWTFRDVPFSRIDNDRITGYRDNAEAEMPSTPTFRYWPTTAAVMSYNKTALWLHTLERHLGWPTMQRILSTYFDRWKFRHPRPADFFQIANEISGQDLTWFFDQVYRGSNTFDYGVQDLLSDRGDDADRRDDAPGARPARHPPRRNVSNRRDRPTLRRGDVPRGRRHDVCRRPPDHRALEWDGPPCDLRLRAGVTGDQRAGRSSSRAAAGHGLHEQQPDARATQPRGQPEVGHDLDGLAAGPDGHLCVPGLTAGGASSRRRPSWPASGR